MAYQALARKWRPKKFADLVGQEHVVRALQNALQQGRLHHAYLLTGTRGVGKTTIARILAKSLNCEQGIDGEPCCECSACTQIDAGRFVDLLEIDAASNTGIDNIREVLENAQYTPTAGRYKVYIIDEVHMLSKSAFNAMLKTLEEPPEHVKFILATTDPHKVPVTVLSRCLQFVLRNMTTGQISLHLAHVLTEEAIPFEEAALTILARAATGSMRDALSLLDQAIALGSGAVSEEDVRHMLGAVDKRYLFALLNDVVKQDGNALMAQAAELSARSVGFDNTLAELASLLQQLALIQVVPGTLSEDEPEKETLLFLAKALCPEQIQLYYQCVLQGKKDLPFAPDEYAGFVMTLLRMLAFAPLAIRPEQMGWQLENTQLQQPVAIGEAVNKSALKPAVLPVSTQTITDKATDSPKIEETVKEAFPLVSDPIPVAAAQVEEVDLPWEETQATLLAESAVSTKTEAAIEPVPVEKSEEAITPDDDILLASVEAQTDQRVSDSTAEVSIEKEAEPLPIVAAPEENTELPIDLLLTQTESEQATPILEAQTPENVPVDEILITDVTEAIELPELTLENWPEIVQKLQNQLGAAQMLAKNAVLSSVEGTVIRLGLSEQAVHSGDMLGKMTKVLSDAYQAKWTIHTETLVCGQQTPNMLHQKELDEKKEQAVAALAADPVAQELLDLFDGQWLPDSIELK